MSGAARGLSIINQRMTSAIRTHRDMIKDLERMMQEQFYQFVAYKGDYPPRGWNESWLYQIEYERNAMLDMAVEIARVKVRGNYFEIVPVSDGDIQRVLDDALTS